MSSTKASEQPAEEKTYEAGCHCGYIKFSVTLSPPLPANKPLQCDCSACRRFGYLLVCKFTIPCHYSVFPLPFIYVWGIKAKLTYTTTDPTRDQVKWHSDSWDRLSRYRFNTKQKDQLFCGKCGASIGIDFREFLKPRMLFGISVSLFVLLLSLRLHTPPPATVFVY